MLVIKNMLRRKAPPINEYSSAFSTFIKPNRLVNLFLSVVFIDLETKTKNIPDIKKKGI